MDYLQEIRKAAADPRRLEELYQYACQRGEAGRFKDDMAAAYEKQRNNLLYTAWYARFWPVAPGPAVPRRGANWPLAIALSLAAGLLLWLLSDGRLVLASGLQLFLLVWAPLEACFVAAYLARSADRPLRPLLPWLLGLAALTAVATLVCWQPGRLQYRVLAMMHVPVLAFGAVGLSVIGWHSQQADRFAFVHKAIEVFVTAGIFAGAVGAFAAVTMGLFEALGVRVAESVMRLLLVGGLGTVPVLAVASSYDSQQSPREQRAEGGLGRLVPTIMWVLLPFTLLVGAIYLLAIPFNFTGPFQNRDLLIVYNAMLFGVLALVVGATPVHAEDLPQKYGRWLRTGVAVLAAMAIVVSVYALSATVYRTLQGIPTPNRVTVIGWNAINIGILAVMLVQLLKRREGEWIDAVHAAIGHGALVYIGWAALLVLLLPLMGM